MADISRLSIVQQGIIRAIDLSAAGNVLVVDQLKLGGATGSVVTKTNWDLLVGGADASALHHHDGRYFTQTQLGSTTGTSGASLIGVAATPTNYTAATQDIEAHLAGIDSALATAGANEYSDAVFRIYDDIDNTKKIAFQAATIATGTVRTITMPDADVDLGQISTNAANITTNANNITNLQNTKADSTAVMLLDGTQSMAADMNLGGFKITNLADPVAAQDAVTKLYADNLVAGLSSKDAVKAATTANLSATYDNGTSGVGATLTATANGALPAIDGVTLAVNDRLLVKDQTSATENGIYVVTQLGDAANPWILTRATDFDGSPSSEVEGGASVFVTEGTANINTVFRLGGTGAKTIGTDTIDWVIYSRAEQVQAGLGLTKTGLTLDFDGTNVVGSGILWDSVAKQLQFDSATVAGTGLTANAGQLNVDGANLAGTGISWNAGTNQFDFDAVNAAGTGLSGSGSQLSFDGTSVVGTGILWNVGQLVFDFSIVGTGLAQNGTQFFFDGANVAGTNLTWSGTTLDWDGTGTAGAALAWSGSQYDVQVDTTTISTNVSGQLQVSDGAITDAKVSATANIALTKLQNSTELQESVTFFQNTDITGSEAEQLTQGTQNADSLHYHGVLKDSALAGQSMPASGPIALRWAISAASETLGSVYLADPTELSVGTPAKDPFHVIGVAIAAGQTAGTSITFVKKGKLTVTAHGFAVGEPIYLGASGVLSQTAPTTAGEAVVRIGIAVDNNTIDINPVVVGVN